MNLPGDPNYPPGMSEWQIESGPEECPECDGTGELNCSDCCGARLHGDYADNLICPECGESCERYKCEECRGTGAETGDD